MAGRKRIKLTMQRCENLACPAGRDKIDVFDAEQQALCLCVTAKGAKSFYLYRRVNGRPARIFLGRFPDITVDAARKEAKRLIGDIVRGIDPRDERRATRNEATLGELWNHFLEKHSKPHKKTWDEDERQYKKYLASWKGRTLSAILKADVLALHAKLGKDHGRYQANRVLALLSTMFNNADEVGYHGTNPCNGVKKFKERSRERYMAADELPRFFVALDEEENDTLRDYFLVSLFTGARRGNVQAMRWDEINLDAGTWTIPDTKSGQPVTLALVPDVVDALRRRRAQSNGSPWVFPSRRKHGKTGHLVEPKTAWRRILDRAGIADLRIHDLRRTLGSWQAAGGASLTVIAKSLGHKSTGATAIYARLNIDPVRQSVEAATSAMLAAGREKSDNSVCKVDSGELK